MGRAGRLSPELCGGIDHTDLIYRAKSIKGLFLGAFLGELGPAGLAATRDKVSRWEPPRAHIRTHGKAEGKAVYTRRCVHFFDSTPRSILTPPSSPLRISELERRIVLR